MNVSKVRKGFSLQLLIVCMFAMVISALGQERFVKPKDEAAKDASFLAFRTKLIAAVERRDAKAVYAIVDPTIKNTFGGDDGIANFKEIWNLESPKSEFWTEFLIVLKNGGSFVDGGQSSKLFSAPYSFIEWPEDLDAVEHDVIFGNNVNLRSAPSMDARVVGRLSYNVVKTSEQKMTPDEKNVDWYRVTTLGGKKGWVKADFVRSSLDYRAGFQKDNGRWKLIYFLSGD